MHVLVSGSEDAVEQLKERETWTNTTPDAILRLLEILFKCGIVHRYAREKRRMTGRERRRKEETPRLEISKVRSLVEGPNCKVINCL